MGGATASLGPAHPVGHAFARTVHRRVSFDTKARRNESLLEALRSLFFEAIMAGLPQAGFWLGRQRPWPGILAEEHITYIHYQWDGAQHRTQAIPLLRLHECFLYFRRRLPLSSSHGPLPLTCLLWIKKNTIAIRPQREQLRSRVPFLPSHSSSTVSLTG